MATNLSPPKNAVPPAIQRLLNLYPYEISEVYESAFMRSEYIVRFVHKSGVKFQKSVTVDDEHKHRINTVEDYTNLIARRLETVCQDLTVEIGEELTGKYPFARLWCDRHLANNKVPFWCNPGKEIPGFAWPKVKKNKEYPQDGTLSSEGAVTKSFDSADITEDGEDEISSTALRKKAVLGKIHKTNVHGAHADMILDGVEMAKTARKVKVVKKTFDPSTIKKPNCKIHNSSMEFDPVTQKWRCQVEGCNLVARPKGDDTDREVRVGKGNIQCRLISNEGELTVVLISDDNVTLDITRFVDIEKLMDLFDAVSIADAASENGRETFSINSAKELPIKMSLTVMGATDLVVHNSDKD